MYANTKLYLARALTSMQGTPDGFIAPEAYLHLTPEQKHEMCNGAGTEQVNVPDHVLGVCFTEPSNIHDFMYGVAADRVEKLVADVTYLFNLVLAVVQLDFGKKPSVGKYAFFVPRLRAALLYFYAVYRHGRCDHAGVVPWWGRLIDRFGRFAGWIVPAVNMKSR